MKGNGGAALPVTENSPLLPEEEDRSTRTEASDQSVRSAFLTEEAEHPWPSTYERSISLLASPIINAKTVDIVTKSPKPGGTPLTMGGIKRRLRKGSSLGEEDFLKLQKHKSLEFQKLRDDVPPPPRKPAAAVLREQEKKAADAHIYRQQLLEKKAQRDEEVGAGGIMSPGYKREKESARIDKKRKSKKEAAKDEKSSFSQCVFNMSNILMGVGILGLPYLFRRAGWIGGFSVTFIFAFVTWKTSILIGRQLNGDPRPAHYFDENAASNGIVRMRKSISSFPDIAREAFGETGCFVLSFVLYFELFSCLCIFFVTLGDHMHSLFPSVQPAKHMCLMAILLTIPTALLRTPTLLSYLSMVGTFATVAVVLSVFLSGVVEGDISDKVAVSEGLTNAKPYHVLWETSGIPLALGLIAYCFSGHAIVPSIYSSMARPNEFESMISLTFVIVIIACLIVAISGYHMFGSVVEDQITISLEENSSADLAMKCLTWLMILTAFSKFTLTAFPLALGIEEIIAPFVSKEGVMEVASSLIKLVLIVLSLGVAIFVPSFSVLCALVGMVCTMTVSVIFPAAAHLKLFGSELGMAEKIVNWIFVVFGSIVAVAGTISTLQDGAAA